MECYALAAAEALPGREVSAEVVYLRDRVERRQLKLAPLDAIRAHLLALGRAIAAARAERGPAGYPKRPAEARECRALGCGYVARCWPRSGQLAPREAGAGGGAARVPRAGKQNGRRSP